MSLTEFLNFASQLNAEHVEIKLDNPHFLPALFKKDKISSIKETLASFNFKYFFHAPTIDVNLASLNPTIGRMSEKVILSSVHLAANVGAELLVSHVGRLSRDYPKNLIEKPLENAVTRLKNLVDTSKALGIVFTIENDHRAEDYIFAGHTDQIRFLVKSLGCKLTFDVGHANTLGKIKYFIDMLSADIVNIHLHDNHSVNDEHLPLGKGEINFAEIFERIKKDKCATPLTLECHSIPGLKRDMGLLKRLFK